MPVMEHLQTAEFIELETFTEPTTTILSMSSSNALKASGSMTSRVIVISTAWPPIGRQPGALSSPDLQALVDQAHKVTLTSRAFRNDQLPLLLQELNQIPATTWRCPWNSGAEAVETAIKAARKRGYKFKGIPDGQAKIIVCANNFHGRTVTAISFSTDEQYRDGSGRSPQGSRSSLWRCQRLRDAITPNTCAFLVEPIEGEAGIVIPPEGF